MASLAAARRPTSSVAEARRHQSMAAGKLSRSLSFSPSTFDDSHRPEPGHPGLPEHEENAGQMITDESEEVQTKRAKFQAYSLERKKSSDASRSSRGSFKRIDAVQGTQVSLSQYLEEIPDEDQVIKKGVLHKLMTGRMRLWERREVLLTADKLCYSAETCIRLAESIPLLEISKITSDAEGNRKKLGKPYLHEVQVQQSPGAMQPNFLEKSNTIEIHTRPNPGEECGRTYYFYAENEEVSLAWTTALQKAVDAANAKFLEESESRFSHYINGSRIFYESDLVQFTVVALIIANFLANVVEFELMAEDPATIKRFDDCDLVFTAIFTLEFICNFFCHLDTVPFPFFSGAWNILDLLVVIVSIVSVTGAASGQSNESIKVIRICRAFRVVRVFKRLTALRLIIVALGASVLPVINTFFVLMVATSVFAILGVGLFSERESAVGSFTHFTEAFFTMFQCISGDGWASNIARPLFRGADSTCSYRDPKTGDCVFDMTVAVFFLSYILIVVIVVVNVVLAVLLDEFLKAANKEKYVRFMQMHTSDGTASQYVSVLDPFLKYFVDCYDSWEMKERVDEIFQVCDVFNRGYLDFRDLREGLQRLPLYPRVTISEEDWRDMTQLGELSSEYDTISSKQFLAIIRNQVRQYVQRVASKSVALNQEIGGDVLDSVGDTTTFLLKYMITAMDELREDMVSMRKGVGTRGGEDEGKGGKYFGEFDQNSPETPGYTLSQGEEEGRCKTNKEADKTDRSINHGADSSQTRGYQLRQGDENKLEDKEISLAPEMVRTKAEKPFSKAENLGQEDLELSFATDDKTTMNVFCPPETRLVRIFCAPETRVVRKKAENLFSKAENPGACSAGHFEATRWMTEEAAVRGDMGGLNEEVDRVAKVQALAGANTRLQTLNRRTIVVDGEEDPQLMQEDSSAHNSNMTMTPEELGSPIPRTAACPGIHFPREGQDLSFATLEYATSSRLVSVAAPLSPRGEGGTARQKVVAESERLVKVWGGEKREGEGNVAGELATQALSSKDTPNNSLATVTIMDRGGRKMPPLLSEVNPEAVKLVSVASNDGHSSKKNEHLNGMNLLSIRIDSPRSSALSSPPTDTKRDSRDDILASTRDFLAPARSLTPLPAPAPSSHTTSRALLEETYERDAARVPVTPEIDDEANTLDQTRTRWRLQPYHRSMTQEPMHSRPFPPTATPGTTQRELDGLEQTLVEALKAQEAFKNKLEQSLKDQVDLKNKFPETDAPKLVSVGSEEGHYSQRKEPFKPMNALSQSPQSSIGTQRAADASTVSHREVLTEMYERLKKQNSITERDMSILEATPQQRKHDAIEQYPASDGPRNDRRSPVWKAVENIEYFDVSKSRLSRQCEASPLAMRDQGSPLAMRPITSAAVLGLEKQQQQQEAAASGARTVDIMIKLGMAFSAAGEEVSPKRTAFVHVLCQDLANASGLMSANFHVQKLSPGSIIADIQMRTHVSGRVLDLEMVARDLEKQAQDATSPLRAGTITRFIQALELRGQLELPHLQPHEHAMQQHKLGYLQQSGYPATAGHGSSEKDGGLPETDVESPIVGAFPVNPQIGPVGPQDSIHFGEKWGPTSYMFGPPTPTYMLGPPNT